MKNTKTKDEKILSQRRKIQGDAYQILIFCLMISILMQHFVLNAPFAQYAVEVFCLIGMGIYHTVRYLSSGIDIWDSDTHSNKRLLTNSIVSSLICVTLFWVLSGGKSIPLILIFLLSFIFLFFIINFMLQSINRKRQKQIEAKSSQDENEYNDPTNQNDQTLPK